MENELKCMKHNLNYAFGKVEVEVWQLNCPLCAKEEIDALKVEAIEMRRHRDLLLRCIDLKQLVERHGA
jgi:hypothetical protein